MPYARNDGVHIHYQVCGQGPALILQHGFSDSLRGWEAAGWTARLAPHFRLVLIDARGHGASDKPHDPAAYTLAQRAGDVLAVADRLRLDRFRYLGYSMGGWIGLGLATCAPGRIETIALGGIHPYGQSMAQYRAGVARGLDAWADVLTTAGAPFTTDADRARFRANDPVALAAAVAEDREPLAERLRHLEAPCLVFAGEADPLHAEALRFAGELPNGRFLGIPGANHVQAFLQAVSGLARWLLEPGTADLQPRPGAGDLAGPARSIAEQSMRQV